MTTCFTTLEKVNKRQKYKNVDFSKCDFFANETFSKKTFSDCNFKNVNFENSTFISSHLEGSDFEMANFTRANLTKAHIKRSNLTGANLTGAILIKAGLKDSTLDKADLTEADLTEANLTTANLTDANLTRAKLTKADFELAKLIRANLTMAKLKKTNFIEADLTGAVLTGGDLTEANLVYANLTGADLTGAILRKTRLFGANLTKANLVNVNLTEAYLAHANLTHADLTGADLTGADLKDTNLTGANLTGAHLTGANLTGTNLTGTIGADLGGIWYQRGEKSKVLLNNITNIVPHDINEQNIKEIKNTFSNNVFDMSMAMEIPITEIDNDEDNVIFYIVNQPMGFLYPREQLKNAYNEHNSIFIACNKKSLSAIPIDIVKTGNVYIRINLTMNFFIKIEDMIELLSSKHKEWLIKKTDERESFTASILNVYDRSMNNNLYMNNLFNQPINIVSGDHCQDGTSQTIYNLTPIKFHSNSPIPLIPSLQLKPKQRCPKGSRKNKKTGDCDKTVNSVVAVVPNVAVAHKRCPKGTRKNKITGKCDPKN